MTINDIDIVFLRNVDWFIDDIEFLRYSWPQKTYVGVRFARKSGWYDHLAAGCKVEDEGARPQSLRRGIFDIRPWDFFWTYIYHRRKFRSQTSDNMDRWKAEQSRGREKRKIRREKIRRERVRRKKMQMREKVGKSRNTVFFQWFEAPEGRKVGSLKRRVRSQLARWEMKNCTPL